MAKLLFQLNLGAQSLCSWWFSNPRSSFFSPRHFIQSWLRDERESKIRIQIHRHRIIENCWISLSTHPRMVSAYRQSESESGSISTLVSLSYGLNNVKECSNGFMSDKHFLQSSYHEPTIAYQRQQIDRFQSFSLLFTRFSWKCLKRDWELVITILTYSFFSVVGLVVYRGHFSVARCCVSANDYKCASKIAIVKRSSSRKVISNPTTLVNAREKQFRDQTLMIRKHFFWLRMCWLISMLYPLHDKILRKWNSAISIKHFSRRSFAWLE